MKPFFCAQCGAELLVNIKAIPAQQRIIKVVQPHTCLKEIPPDQYEPLLMKDRPKKQVELDAIFDKFQFVSKLNKLPVPKKEVEEKVDKPEPMVDASLLNEALIDRRPKENMRDTSTAPKNLLDHMKGQHHTVPERDMKGD